MRLFPAVVSLSKSGILTKVNSNLPNTNSKIGDLLWVDDVALLSTDEKQLQEMLDITDKTAKKYRIEFGKEKSKVLKIGKKGEQNPKFKLGDMELDLTETYEYLGETINNKGNIENHIKKIRGKAEAAYQTVRIVAGNKDLNFSRYGNNLEINRSMCITHNPIRLRNME